ncbi:MAG: hypothetical protein M3Y87_13415 [Myxococcota bacterium]|nr:hypothetical protein [Myxococcota bacterium]
MTLRFEWEWLDAPGVRVASHAASWARLEIWLGDTCATRVEDLATRSVRTGIYVPLAPLADWLVQNWWFLTEETALGDRSSSARLASPEARRWFARHNLLFAREGAPMPDLTIARADAEHALVRLCRDPRPIGGYPVRFIEERELLVARAALAGELRRFVGAAVSRLEGCGDADATELREGWRRLSTCAGDDARLMARAAALGLDGADPLAVDDALAGQLAYGFDGLPPSAVDDLLEGVAAPARALARAREVARVREIHRAPLAAELPSTTRSGSALLRARAQLGSARASTATMPAHEAGWRLARALRSDVLALANDAASATVEDALAGVLGVEHHDATFDDSFLRGWVDAPEHGVTMALSPARTSTRRFLAARGVALALLGGRERVITDAQSRSQRISRAFATELVAPIAYLEARVEGPVVSVAAVNDLARALGAPRQAVIHQIENHDLAMVE